MNRRAAAAVAAMVPVSALVAFAPSAATEQAPAIPFADARMIIEVNGTDGDAGFQVFLDGEPWNSITIFTPDGQRLVDVRGRSELNDFGLTELFAESNEPPFDELPLEEFLALFPEGEYRFEGTTVEGIPMTGSATFTHNIPRGPEVLPPDVDARQVNADDVVIEWVPADQPPGVEVVGYQVIVEREDPLRVFQVDLPATARSVDVPDQFIERDTEYVVEVLAIEAGGNQTITELTFHTR
jgi:Fibronectin type III domain